MEGIKIYNDKYVVFESGLVYSNSRKKFLKEQIDNHGYGYYRLYDEDGKSVHWFTHKIVATFFIQNLDNKKFVNHIDGNKRNNSLNNLEWCTLKENNLHARKNGLNDISRSNAIRWDDESFREKVSAKISNSRITSGVGRGRNNPNAKVDLAYNEKMWTMSELAKELGVTVSALNNIKRRIKQGHSHNFATKHNIRYIRSE